MQKIRALIADDHALFRQGLKVLLDTQENIEVVAETSSCEETLALFNSTKPDLVILDLSLSDGMALDHIPKIKSIDDEVKVIVLSMHRLKPYVVAAKEKGAHAYIEKDLAFEELIHGINFVKEGHFFASQNVVQWFDEASLSKGEHEESPLDCLSKREFEVFGYLADGWPTKTIAVHLGLSPKTVESHRVNIMVKLDVFTVIDLTKLAIKHGVIQL